MERFTDEQPDVQAEASSPKPDSGNPRSNRGPGRASGGSGGGPKHKSKRRNPRKHYRQTLQSDQHSRRSAKDNAAATNTPDSQGLDPGAWRLNAKSAISVTLYDMSGAPLHPIVLREMEDMADRLAKWYKLVAHVEQG